MEEEPAVETDPATGFPIDSGTGWLVHPPTGFLIEPGTNLLVLPGSLAYSNFRWDPVSGLVDDVIEEGSASAVAEPTVTATPEATPVATASSSAAATTPPSTSTTAAPSSRVTPPAGGAATDQVSSEQNIGSHPVTRILVILLLVGLGVLYYARLRSSSDHAK